MSQTFVRPLSRTLAEPRELKSTEIDAVTGAELAQSESTQPTSPEPGWCWNNFGTHIVRD